MNPIFASNKNGVMIALQVPEDIKKQLVINETGAESVEDLHLTLVFLGNAEEVVEDDIVRAKAVCSKLAATTPKLEAKISGIGRFSGEKKDAVYASVDSLNLGSFRESLVTALDKAKVNYKKDHGFTPHITLTYIPIDSDMPLQREAVAAPFVFSDLSLHKGTEVEKYPLGGNASKNSVPKDGEDEKAESMTLLMKRRVKERREQRELETVLRNVEDGIASDRSVKMFERKTGLNPKHKAERHKYRRKVGFSAPIGLTEAETVALNIERALGWWSK